VCLNRSAVKAYTRTGGENSYILKLGTSTSSNKKTPPPIMTSDKTDHVTRAFLFDFGVISL
jgi:hypothetical protein